MKKRRISTYIIGLLMTSSLCCLPIESAAQQKDKKIETTIQEQPLYQGIYAGVDVFGIAGKIFGSDFTSAEAGVEVNLKNKYFPVIEIGYGSTDTTDDETDIHYKTSAPYFRIGAGYNVFHKKPHLPGHFIVGLRYGFSSFSYDVDGPAMTDPIWGDTSIPLSYQGVKGSASWLELVASLRTNVYKNFYMGFSIRYKSTLSVKKAENSEPWYIPGYGKNKSNTFGITYNLIYKLPF
ncbi:MAG: hypothetical protein IJY59_09040 [Bacteroidaceae bacterium]|nr:hypothetical protein [Bacteroidaceae bacterium]